MRSIYILFVSICYVQLQPGLACQMGTAEELDDQPVREVGARFVVFAMVGSISACGLDCLQQINVSII